jgi:hypothetical protein
MIAAVDPPVAAAPRAVKLRCHYCSRPAETVCGYLNAGNRECKRPLCNCHAFGWQNIALCHRHVIELAEVHNSPHSYPHHD